MKWSKAKNPGHVCRAGGGGALLAFGVFEELDPIFTPTLSTLDPQTIRDALNAPDANEWRAAMDVEISRTCVACTSSLAMIGIFNMEAIAKYPPARRNLYELWLPSDLKNGRYSMLKFVKAAMAAHSGSKPELEVLHTRDLEIVTHEVATYLHSLLIADCHPSLFSCSPCSMSSL